MTMMNTKKGRAWFVPGLVVLPVLLFYLSFFRGEEMGSSPGRQLELQTFQSGDGWGYQIRMNGKVLIYQPTIPSIDTVTAFPNEESARNIGTLVLNRLTENKDFSVSRDEIQRSLSYLGPVSYTHLTLPTTSRV